MLSKFALIIQCGLLQMGVREIRKRGREEKSVEIR